MDRKEHLEWCKQRAIEYIDDGDLNQAFVSMLSDMSKHPETQNHLALEMSMSLKLGGCIDTPNEMRKFIEGFN